MFFPWRSQRPWRQVARGEEIAAGFSEEEPDDWSVVAWLGWEKVEETHFGWIGFSSWIGAEFHDEYMIYIYIYSQWIGLIMVNDDQWSIIWLTIQQNED